jgi:hypothetical protein
MNNALVVRVRAQANFVLWILVMLLSLIAGVLIYLYRGQRKQNAFFKASYYEARHQYQTTRSQLSGISFELEQKKNALRQEQTKTQVLVADNRVLKELFANQQSQFAYTLKNLEVKVKDLQSVANFRVETSGQFVTITKDTIQERIVPPLANHRSARQDTVREKIKLIQFQEPQGWFSLTGSIQGDTMQFKPTFREEYDLAIYRERAPKRGWWDLLPAKRTVGKINTKNPYSSVKEFTVVAKRERRKFLGIF